jgi:hypothetical protein
MKMIQSFPWKNPELNLYEKNWWSFEFMSFGFGFLCCGFDFIYAIETVCLVFTSQVNWEGLPQFGDTICLWWATLLLGSGAACLEQVTHSPLPGIGTLDLLFGFGALWLETGPTHLAFYLGLALVLIA